uniref:ZP domain-containing protein n=1 Tax=Strigamia maritima TaxID=126957 RepID=T1J1E1_STRMM
MNVVMSDVARKWLLYVKTEKMHYLDLMKCLFVPYLVLSYFVQAEICDPHTALFELITGHVLTSSSATIDSQPETLILDDCLAACRRNASCAAVNYETGLCVLFSLNADQKPKALSPSQFPVFTLYGQKICPPDNGPSWSYGESEWAWERVLDSELKGYVKKQLHTKSRTDCAMFCLQEEEFTCRSANYDYENSLCSLNDMDRFSLSHVGVLRMRKGVDYLENHYVSDPARLCEYQKVDGRIMKTVDAVYRNITSLDGCRRLCSASPFRCRSFDFGATDEDVCRLSHHASASLTHIHEPYLEMADTATYELSACYNVTVECRSADMIARILTNRLFNGKIYAKSRPRSCVTDVSNELEFELRMAYGDVNCNVQHDSYGAFSNDIVLQHHDLIVTNQDLGLSVHCQYDLQNKSVSNGVNLNIQGYVTIVAFNIEKLTTQLLLGKICHKSEKSTQRSAENEMKNMASEAGTVPSPNVSMKIISRVGHDLGSAQVGDSLALRFEIVDENSPYEIFVRELVASDGLPGSSEILLIDSLGCPTDATIMGPLAKVNNNGQMLDATFDAFKFPSSEVVQFKALVTPCLSVCDPVQCNVLDGEGAGRKEESFGRKRRSVLTSTANEQLIISPSLHVHDRFTYKNSNLRKHILKTLQEKINMSFKDLFMWSLIIDFFLNMFNEWENFKKHLHTTHEKLVKSGLIF